MNSLGKSLRRKIQQITIAILVGIIGPLFIMSASAGVFSSVGELPSALNVWLAPAVGEVGRQIQSAIHSAAKQKPLGLQECQRNALVSKAGVYGA